MSKKDEKKFAKKKAREKRVQEKLRQDREVKQKVDQEERQEYQRIKRIKKFKKSMGKLNAWADDVLMTIDDKTFSQLERNAKILKALEEEYEKEMAQKGQLNDKLEKLGLKTLEEKMQYLHKMMTEEQMADEDIKEALIAQTAMTDDSSKRIGEKVTSSSRFLQEAKEYGDRCCSAECACEEKSESN